MSQFQLPSIPLKVFSEAKGLIITCNVTRGDVYRGTLVEAEENMNCLLSDVSITYRDGKTDNADNLYIRGRKIKSFILPEKLKESSVFSEEVRMPKTGKGRGRGINKSARHPRRTDRPGPSMRDDSTDSSSGNDIYESKRDYSSSARREDSRRSRRDESECSSRRENSRRSRRDEPGCSKREHYR